MNMELSERLNVLIQAAQLAQNGGILSLDDAVVVKTAIDNIRANKDVDTAVKVLINVAQIAQSKGCYTLKDASIIYIAIDGIDSYFQTPPNNKVVEENEKGEE